mmetsp:Transcript_68170/g.181364  ORF Transcript_68170/g.181364 Transcript_68170/m.181364 type:complete len:214 (-) Transcript_68170:373-1014(-)
MRSLPRASESFRRLLTVARTMRLPGDGPGSVVNSCRSALSCQGLASLLLTPAQRTTSSLRLPLAPARPCRNSNSSWVSAWSLVNTSPASRSRAAVTTVTSSSISSEQLGGLGTSAVATPPSGGQTRSTSGSRALRPGSTSMPRAPAEATKETKGRMSARNGNVELEARWASWKDRSSRSWSFKARFAGRYCSSLACVTLHIRGTCGRGARLWM